MSPLGLSMEDDLENLEEYVGWECILRADCSFIVEEEDWKS